MPDTFRVLVTGSRSFPSEDAVWERLAFVLAENLPDGGTLTVVHGDCPTGADHFAHTWCALPSGDEVIVEECHPADWAKHGKAAGPIRNAETVAAGADLVLAFPLPGDRNQSRGTWHCIDTARAAGLTVEIVPPAGPRFTAGEIAEARRAAQG
ncbi:DUF2493 domain-containing protein [Nocardia sp. NBC_00565]|uniref:SLOG family protein n=1 Tax=Nocardia sp. NBC_00565 TaxID=2975993 RepID=UPI002E81BE4E|nr:SLOG family protein [Nocardia sp. NBC_00565]WUC03677.1 DUF2493 domain-containing protein [Nocardia sp. NBC_00565]